MQNLIHETVENFLKELDSPFEKIKIEFEESDKLYRVNIESHEPSLLIGYHGENIWAIQHVLKLLLWKKTDQEFNIFIDVDHYRRKQEDSVIDLAEKKVESVRKFQKPQSLPAMSAYFRRIVHLHLAKENFSDIDTESEGADDSRFIIIKPKLQSENVTIQD